jgi:DNA-directed RNA polymerase sigma subunit (sigma70/sigma32)
MFSNSRDITPTTKLFIDIYIKISTFINVLLIISTTMRQLKIQPSITVRDSASLDRYLQDIGKEELIDALQEVELAQRIKQGDKQALEKLIKANLRFVVSVAKQYQNQ